jgi:peptidoglycan/LPS O-acetylase OafA/YrhL
VDVFFVLSGFLITSLLLEELTTTGTLRFGLFYARRARRLLPGVLVLLVLVALYAAWFAEPDTLVSLRGDALSTLTYVANWHFVLSDQGYFHQTGPPSPLLHTWSLAVEEQFYLVWPAVCWIVLRRWGRRGLALAATAGIVLSVAATLALATAGAGTDRLYYGTDVRTQEVMVGALLAVVGPRLTRWRLGSTRRAERRARSARLRQMVLVAVGTAGFLAVLAMFHSVSGTGSFLYHGGFLVVAAAAAALTALVVHQPGAAVSRLLALAPLRYLGRISYGVYLYHFPLFLILTAPRTGLEGAGLLALRLGATIALAALSFHFVELPVRNHRLWSPARLTYVLPSALAGVLALTLVTTTLGATGLAGETPADAIQARPALFALPERPPAGLAGAHRVRVVIEGDSLAVTLGWGLGLDAMSWGARVTDLASVGCDLDPDSMVSFQDQTTAASQGCKGWPATYAQMVKSLDPDVVVLEVGRWELSDRLIDGRWSTIGQRAWDMVYSSELRRAIRILSARGARVVVLTLPYVVGTSQAPDGQPWDINEPSRTRQYNALVRQVVAQVGHGTSVIDLNKMLDPRGVFTSYLDGVRVRTVDNEHITPAGGMLLRPMILPKLVALGRAHAEERAARASTAGPTRMAAP